jgi:hypothetical protein
MDSKSNLFEVVAAAHPAGGFTGSLDGGQK